VREIRKPTCEGVLQLEFESCECFLEMSISKLVEKSRQMLGSSAKVHVGRVSL
jgi:hypothetical protein